MVPTVVQDACTYLTGVLNLTKDVTVGIVSVLYAGESKLNTGSQGVQSTETPGALNPSGAYGIASWNGARQAAFAAKYGLQVEDLFTQLHFVVTESANSYPQVWAAMQNPATTYQQMIVAFTDYYEVPANKANEISVAGAFAASIYDSVVVPTTATPMPAPAPALAAVTAPHVDVPAPVAAIVQAVEGAVGAAVPVIAAVAPVVGAVAPLVPGVAALALPTSLVLDQGFINAIVQAEPLIASLLSAIVKASIAGSTSLKAS